MQTSLEAQTFAATPCSAAAAASPQSLSSSSSVKSSYLTPLESSPASQTNVIKSVLTSIGSTLTTARKSTTQLYRNHKLTSSIRTRHKSEPASISYEEFSLMKRNEQDRWKVLNVLSLLVFASDVAPYAIMFYPRMLPSTFEARHQGEGGAEGIPASYVQEVRPPLIIFYPHTLHTPLRIVKQHAADTPSQLMQDERDRSKAVVETLLAVEASCHKAGFLEGLNPFGKAGVRKRQETLKDVKAEMERIATLPRTEAVREVEKVRETEKDARHGARTKEGSLAPSDRLYPHPR